MKCCEVIIMLLQCIDDNYIMHTAHCHKFANKLTNRHIHRKTIFTEIQYLRIYKSENAVYVHNRETIPYHCVVTVWWLVAECHISFNRNVSIGCDFFHMITLHGSHNSINIQYFLSLFCQRQSPHKQNGRTMPKYVRIQLTLRVISVYNSFIVLDEYTIIR